MININRIIKATLVALTILVLLAIPLMSSAAESMQSWEITQIVEKVDKNGNDYIRFICKEDRTLQGQAYVATFPVMAFSGTADMTKAREYNVGDTLKAVVNTREYRGSDSHSILTFAN